ncbi:MAG: uroporphyrinogen-III C-methyltransferase [Cyclobacteriaceae bacterium]|nr:uroporphyrinogen-III C-methyltransferase [Cyclobacteriaceae bacterium]
MGTAINKNINPLLTVIGAGPGDPELITVKAVKALAVAKVVLYDALVHPDLLNHAPKDSIKILVGKRASFHSYTQDEINKLIVTYAKKYGNVVRLKGGDPFIFGRGKEEIEYAHSYGVKSKIVPGLTSATSLPALQGISLTTRGINESFWVVTGTTKSGVLSSDISLAAQSTATVVVLMGRNKLSEIISIYKSLGRESQPIALIQNGSLPNEKIALGTIKNIEEEVLTKKIGTPAIIIIGDVVNQHHDYLYKTIEQNLRQTNYEKH